METKRKTIIVTQQFNKAVEGLNEYLGCPSDQLFSYCLILGLQRVIDFMDQNPEATPAMTLEFIKNSIRPKEE